MEKHTPEIVYKFKDLYVGDVYGVICHECSEEAQDYIRCTTIRQYPTEVIANHRTDQK